MLRSGVLKPRWGVARASAPNFQPNTGARCSEHAAVRSSPCERSSWWWRWSPSRSVRRCGSRRQRRTAQDPWYGRQRFLTRAFVSLRRYLMGGIVTRLWAQRTMRLCFSLSAGDASSRRCNLGLKRLTCVTNRRTKYWTPSKSTGRCSGVLEARWGADGDVAPSGWSRLIRLLRCSLCTPFPLR